MRFYFIRHAQSADNQFVVDNAHKGVKSHGLDQSWVGRQADPELSGSGQRQAETLGRFVAQKKGSASEPAARTDPYLDDFSFTHVYASLMVRTMETAGAVAKALHVTPAIWEDIHETGGIWEPDQNGELVGGPGKSRAYFEKRFPRFTLPDDLGEKGWWNRPLETGRDCKERAQRGSRDLMARPGDTEDRVAVVSHGLFYSFMMRAILKIPSGTGTGFAMNNAAMTRIDFTGSNALVIYLNRTSHFAPELVT